MRSRAESGLGGTAFAHRGPRDASAPGGGLPGSAPSRRNGAPVIPRSSESSASRAPEPRPPGKARDPQKRASRVPASRSPDPPLRPRPSFPSAHSVRCFPRRPRSQRLLGLHESAPRGAVPRRLPSSPSENLVLVPRSLRSHHHGSPRLNRDNTRHRTLPTLLVSMETASPRRLRRARSVPVMPGPAEESKARAESKRGSRERKGPSGKCATSDRSEDHGGPQEAPAFRGTHAVRFRRRRLRPGVRAARPGRRGESRRASVRAKALGTRWTLEQETRLFWALGI